MARYLCKFEKGYGVKFISHLDLVRCIQRAVRRAQIPVTYSKGFNPHAELSLVTPLPVGTWSTGEYMEIYLDNEIDEGVILNKLNDMLPQAVKFTAAKHIDNGLPAVMGMVDSADYEITIVNIIDNQRINDMVQDFLNIDSIQVNKWSKKGQKQINIKPMIRDMKLLSFDRGILVFSASVDAGSRSNLNPELIFDGIKQYIPEANSADIRDIKKIETYIKMDGNVMLPLNLAHTVSL